VEETGGGGTRPAAAEPKGRLVRSLAFLRLLVAKAEKDNIFFMAGAISFNLIAAVPPLLFFMIGVGGFVLQARFGDPAAVLVQLLLDTLPNIRGDIDLMTMVEELIQGLILDRGGLTFVGALLLVWFSTRLVGTLRTALQVVFDVGPNRGIVHGKLFDARVVVVGGALFVLNMGITSALKAARDLGVDIFALEGRSVSWLQQGLGILIAFASIWVLFLGLYRFLPARRIPWRTALIAANFAAISHEVLKIAFAFYATEVANYSTTYGNLITLAVLFFWIYYEAQVFILGGEFAQVWTTRSAALSRGTGATLDHRTEGR
jgi:membrane protein